MPILNNIPGFCSCYNKTCSVIHKKNKTGTSAHIHLRIRGASPSAGIDAFPWKSGSRPNINTVSPGYWNSHVKAETLQWRHNGRDCVSNHQPRDFLPKRLFRRRSNKTSKLRVTGLCAGNSLGTGEFPAQMASNAENVFIWWRHHETVLSLTWDPYTCKTSLYWDGPQGLFLLIPCIYSGKVLDYM